ncbi:hypothetical protein [Micromonospora maritima]|uniref:hypothetical protein n=1 Tax=Micromonospora maritima TaxID=986711 RepID=UPI001FE9081D|nr:hypothetical protein [Micromonospora maritima]
MITFRRAPADPELERARAEAAREQARADLERVRVEAQIQRERQAADAEFTRQQAIADEQEKRRRDLARRAEQAERRDRRRASRAEFTAKLRPVLPLLLINGGAAYAQAAYAYEHIAPEAWNAASKLTFAVAFAIAMESVAVYVQWHAHDALLLKAHATAASLRRASWTIAAVVAAINYAHFAGEGMAPTAAAVAFALLSLLSPWLWGLHTRRAQHVQLLAEDADLIDEGGVEFSPQRRRAFPVRAWLAKRWSIDHYERDPRRAWEGYNRDRRRKLAERRADRPAPGRVRAAVRLLAGRPLVGQMTVDEQAAIDNALADTRRATERVRALAATMPLDLPPVAIAAPPARHGDDLEALVVATSEPATRPDTPAAVNPPSPRQPDPTPAAIVAHPTPDTEPDRAPDRQPATVAATAPATRITRRVATRPDTKTRQTTAERVAALRAKHPDMTQEQVAKKLGVSERTVQRHWPKPASQEN